MAGFVALLNTKNDESTLDIMMDEINYRGPDYRLKYADDNLQLGYLGLDLSYKFDRKELVDKDHYLVLVTGYITNVDELIEICKEKGISSQEEFTPALMVYELYKLEKDNFANYVKGSYVITIYDKASKELTFIRDRFAVQPIYYYQTEAGLIVASENKALIKHPEFKKELNKDALLPYLVFQSPSLRETFFKNVYSLPAAAIMKYKSGNISIDTYWDIEFEPESMDLEQASETINDILGKSIEDKVKYFGNRDAIGQSLSGGVDSSYLAARFKPKKTFTVGYNDKEFSEIDNAKDLSKIIGAENISEIIDSEKSFSNIENIAYLLDQPFANLSAIPMYYLSKRISEHTHSVFSGEGSDEFFGGYFEYTEPKYMNIYKALPQGIRSFIGNKMLAKDKDFKGKNFLIKGLPVEDWYIGQAKIFHESEALSLVKSDYTKGPKVRDIISPYYEKVKDKSDIQKKQYLDFHVWMVNDIALKADRMNIANSVQLITPILDENLLDFARRLPDELKIQGPKVKVAFRNAALKHLPDDWAKRKKKGYVVPVKHWLKEEKYSKLITEKLTGDLAKEFFDVEELKRLIQENLDGVRPHHRKLWTVYMFLVWYEEYFIKR